MKYSGQTSKYSKGQKVVAKCIPEGGFWFEATIKAVYRRGRTFLYLIKWADGDTRDTVKLENEVSRHSKLKFVDIQIEETPENNERLVLKDKVEAAEKASQKKDQAAGKGRSSSPFSRKECEQQVYLSFCSL